MGRKLTANEVPDDGQYFIMGEVPAQEVTQQLAKSFNPALMKPRPLTDQIIETTPPWKSQDITRELSSFLQQVDYHPRDKPLLPRFKSIPFYTRVDDKIVGYLDNHTRNRKEKGKPEAAEYGIGKIDDQDIVVFATNYGFMGGSLSTVVGEKLLQSITLAGKSKKPLVTVYSSGGARQAENVRALYQMERTVVGLEVLRERSPHVPNIAVLLGQVWGGVTASSMPRSDLRIAYTGTRMGFAGSRVIADHEGVEVPETAQRAERGNVDVLVGNTTELTRYIGRLLSVSKLPTQKFDASLIPPTHIVKSAGNQRHFRVSETILAPLLYEDDPPDAAIVASMEPRSEPSIDSLFKLERQSGKSESEALRSAEGQSLKVRYGNLLFDSARMDTEMFIKYGLQDSVGLYNRLHDEERGEERRPAIIAAVGRIGTHPVMVIGDQPSYRIAEGKATKILSSPKPADIKYLHRMINLGDRMKLPLVLLTDTPGAEPSLASEMQGQFEDIANVLARYHTYGQPIMSIVTGLQGSGGGLITSPRGDSIAMLDKALMTVAEPGAASVIVYGANPSHQELIDTIQALGPDSRRQSETGIVDTVIPEGMSPYQTVANIRNYIVKTYAELADMKSQDLLGRRWDRLRHAEAFRVSESGS